MDDYVEAISMRLKKIESKVGEFGRWQEFSNAQYNSMVKAIANQQHIIKMILSSINAPIELEDDEDI